MLNFMVFDAAENVFLVIALFLLSLIVLIGCLVPIAAAITYAIYRIRMKFKFTWEKDLIEMEEDTKTQTEAI